MAREPLESIDVVLVEPQGPRNVGSVARSLKNFGLRHLTLVGGPDPDHPECRMMAVRGGDVLRAARRVPDLDAALADRTFVLGTTARQRGRLPTLDPAAAAQLVLEEAARGRVALVFGREDAGLTGEELRRAHRVVAIEASPECRALNLAQAVLIVAYEIFRASRAERAVATSDAGRILTAGMAARLKEDLLAAMGVLGLFHEGTEVAYRQSMERLLALGPMQTRDARLLFAIARRILQLEHVLGPHRHPRRRTVRSPTSEDGDR